MQGGVGVAMKWSGPYFQIMVRSPFLLWTELHPTQIYTSTQSETPSTSGCVCFWRSCLFKRWLRWNCQHPLHHQKSTRVPEKHLLLLYRICQSLWLCGSQQTVENSESDRKADHLTCLLRNLYAGQEATVGAGLGTIDWFQIRKGVCQGCILSPC